VLSKLCRSFGCSGRTAYNRKIQGPFARVPLLVLGLFAFLLTALPALAAVELAYFGGRSEPDALVLEWASLREVNLARWDVYCKDELDLPAAYHLIGAVEALGSPSEGHAYTFPVPELTPGVPYCFRLDEITVDGTPGESFDICGLGYGVTPTPAPPEDQGAGVVADRSYGPGTPIPGSAAAAQPDGTNLVTSTPTVTPAVPPTATPVSVSPLDTPVAGAQNSLATPPPFANGSDVPAPGAQSPGSSAAIKTEPAAGLALAMNPTPLPDPGYIVVTATPTSETVAQLSPTFTPLPTTTPGSDVLAAQLLDWDAESLVMALLCFVFFGATGIGVLGITSLGLYFSSRSDDRRR
jgi:hypothetical protein